MKSALSYANTALSNTYDAIAFSHHVDSGYTNSKYCRNPAPGWDVIYYYQFEIVSLLPLLKTCPPVQNILCGWYDDLKKCSCKQYRTESHKHVGVMESINL